jgi:cyclic nucleotide-binding protein
MGVESPDASQLEIRLASTPAELDACEEVIRKGFGRVMRLGVEPEADERQSLTTLYCIDTGSNRIVAASRLVSLDYLNRSESLVKEYQIGSIPAELRSRSLLSFQSAALPDLRGTEVMSRLFQGCWEFGINAGHLLTVSACKPYLFAYFMSMGFRPFERAYISSDGGYRIPIVLLHYDQDYLRACRSPFASALPATHEIPGASATKEWFQRSCPDPKDMNVTVITRPEQVQIDLGFFRGLSEPTIHSIFRYGVEIACRQGDLLIKEKAPEHVIGFIVNGSVNVFKGEKQVATLKAGEIFGEVGFLLQVPRTASLVAGTDDTRIAFISVRSLDAIKDPAEAAIFWRNLGRHLAARLQQTTELL